MLRRTLLILLMAAVCCGAAAGADTYTMDPAHSSMGFSVRHMMITNVRGGFREFSGTLMYDEQDVLKSSVEVHIKTASIDTGNANRDADLRSANFFEVEKFPEITFKSTRVAKNGDGFTLHGPLTIRDVTREVAIPFKITGKVKDPRGATRMGVEGGLTINRKDFGVTWSRVLEGGGAVVSDEVKIELLVEFVKRAAPTP